MAKALPCPSEAFVVGGAKGDGQRGLAGTRLAFLTVTRYIERLDFPKNHD